VAALDNGHFVTVWDSGTNVHLRFTSVTYGPDPNNPNNPSAAIVTHLGATQTGVAAGANPAVAALPGGKFVVLWYNNAGGSPNQIFGRLYDENATSLGDFVVAANVDRNAGLDRDIAVTVLDRTRFAVAWTGIAGTSPNGVDASGAYIDGAIFNSAAPVGSGAFTVVSSLAAFSGG
jgi:hypothetical protein